MNLELWVLALLDSIKEAGYKGKEFDLHLDNDTAKEIAYAYDNAKWIEI